MTYCCYIHYMYAPCGICIGLLLTFASNGPQLRALRMFRELCVILTVGLQSFQLQKYRINKIVNLFQFYVQTLGRHQSQHFCCLKWQNILSKPLPQYNLVYSYQNCSDLLWEKIILLIEKNFWNFEAEGPRIFKNFEITKTIYSNSERSEQFLVTECFFNLFLEVSHI